MTGEIWWILRDIGVFLGDVKVCSWSMFVSASLKVMRFQQSQYQQSQAPSMYQACTGSYHWSQVWTLLAVEGAGRFWWTWQNLLTFAEISSRSTTTVEASPKNQGQHPVRIYFFMFFSTFFNLFTVGFYHGLPSWSDCNMEQLLNSSACDGSQDLGEKCSLAGILAATQTVQLL